MKRILFLFLPFLPYLASAQVAKDTVTVLTIADIPAGAIRDTTNFTFVQDNGFKKATFDSLYKYTRVKLLAADAITSAELANALSNETGTGAAVFGTSPTITGATISGGSINNTPIGASTANTGAFTTLTASSTATATKFIPTGGAATGDGMYLPATNTLAFSTDGAERMRITSTGNVGIGTNNPASRLVVKGIGATDGTTAFNVTNSNNNSMFSVRDDGLVSANSLSLTNPLPVSSGGTNVGSFTANGILYASTASQVATSGNLTFNGAGTFTINAPADNFVEFVFRESGVLKWNGYNDYNTDNYQIGNSTGPKFSITQAGNVGIGVVSPSSTLHLKAGTASANTSPLKFTSGTNLTTPEAGAMEFNGTNLFFTPSNTRHTVNHGLAGSATLDFVSTNAQNSQDLTITVTGASDGDVVSLGVPNASVNANTCFTAWVSAANTVTVRFNNYSSGAVDPASGTFKVFVTK